MKFEVDEEVLRKAEAELPARTFTKWWTWQDLGWALVFSGVCLALTGLIGLVARGCL